MTDKVFVDTNILLYARDSAQPDKQPVAQAWMRSLWLKRNGYLSFQVLQEFYVNATQKLKPGLPVELARQDVRNLLLWRPIGTDAGLIEGAWRLADRYGFSWWDAQIVAAARRANCPVLLSEDMQHGIDVEGTRIINPFAADAPQPA
ncbi:MAG: PIN domain-containing protein [Hydrogenophilales bacterium]|jgi:predicted nucleic acid-binding protein|nr:PIN domain-containing protein [Hydrogenophilales bacterium]